VSSIVSPWFAIVELSPGHGVDDMYGGLPLVDRGGLQTGVAGVLREGGPGDVRGVRGSLRAWGQAKALRRVLAGAGVGRVQRQRSTDAGRTADETLSCWRFTALLRHSKLRNK